MVKKLFVKQIIYIEDNYLEEQSGVYHFLLKNGKVLFKKQGIQKETVKKVFLLQHLQNIFLALKKSA